MPPRSWPWPYRATQHFTLTPASLTVALTLTNEGDGPMPAGLGWHPYFPRTPRTTITAAVRAVWLTDDEMMPTALAAPTPPPTRRAGWRWTRWRSTTASWAGAAARPSSGPRAGASLAMTAGPPLDYLVIFTPAGPALLLRGAGQPRDRRVQPGPRGARGHRPAGPRSGRDARDRDHPDSARLTPRAAGPGARYWMTSSARASSDGGMVSPISAAVFRLIISSNLVGRSTGRSAGLAPFRMRSTYIAARW